MILLLGASGHVGKRFAEHLASRGRDFAMPGREHAGNLAHPGKAETLIEQIRPDAVINAAGWPGSPNVDATVEEPIRCLEANLTLPLAVARACEKRKIPLGHVSTGCIYFGRREDGQGFTESDPPNFGLWSEPAGLYSRCKDLAEKTIPLLQPASWLWRLRMPFDHIDHPRNYLSKILRYSCLLEAVNSLSHLDDFASTCLDSMEKTIPFGTYNLTNPGEIRTSEISAMMEQAGVAPAGKEWRFFDSEEEFMERAARVRRACCVLDSSKIGRTGLPMRPVRQALQDALQRWTSAPFDAR